MITPLLTKLQNFKFTKLRLTIFAYLLLLGLSTLFFREESGPLPGQQTMQLPPKDSRPTIRLAYREIAPAFTAHDTPILLLHGSPVAFPMFETFFPALGRKYHVLAPDLPGFDGSSWDLPDYSFAAHAKYIEDFLDTRGIKKVHLVGYSMGGGVALHFANSRPESVASLTMLSAIGVQELELLGDYHLNRALHWAQWVLLWSLENGTPHFGLLDSFPLNTRYARNFYDSDQRPLRKFLIDYRGPLLIQHGDSDGLVSPVAAREHARLTPGSVLKFYKGGHSLVLNKGPELAKDLDRFIKSPPTRGVFNPKTAPPPFTKPAAEDLALLVLILLIAVATFVSEDLASIGAGILAARGVMDLHWAIFAAFLGIFVGDMLLYLAGRWPGRPAIKKAPLKWFIKESALENSARWFEAKGPAIIFISRFVPGMRLPTYFGAGVIGAGFWSFSLYFLLAAALWTPLLVGLSAWVGKSLIDYFLVYQKYALAGLGISVLLLYLFLKLVVPLFSFRGRRLLISAFKRRLRWEFWSSLTLYFPIFFYILYLGLKNRGMTLFSVTNPFLRASMGGMIGESKSEILSGLKDSPEFTATFRLVPNALPLPEKLQAVEDFLKENDLSLPLVLKPDKGDRGAAVLIARDHESIKTYLEESKEDIILQEFIPGVEFGVFYIRYPQSDKGFIFSITDKHFTSVTGNGKHNLEELILLDKRAIYQAPLYLETNRERLYEVPPAGEKIKLVEIGTHSRGSLFLDAWHVYTPELENRIDEIMQKFDGFYFGRFDIRTPDIEALKSGESFKILELNALTSEATHMYDPKYSVFYAWKTLAKQWAIAFEIGRQNRERGEKPMSVGQFFKFVWTDVF